MPRLFNCFGLDVLQDETFLRGVVEYTLRTGSHCEGYQGVYIYRNFGMFQLICHGFPETEDQYNFVGVSSHCVGSSLWSYEISPLGTLPTTVDNDKMSRCVLIQQDATSNKVVPLHLAMNDVLPSFLPGDRLVAQVAALPYNLDVYRNEEELLQANAKQYEYIENFRIGEIFNVDLWNEKEGTLNGYNAKPTQGIVFFTGKVEEAFDVEAVMYDDFNEGATVTLSSYRQIKVWTSWGSLDMPVSKNMLEAANVPTVSIGDIVAVGAFLSGHVGIGPYLEGFQLDVDHHLALLKQAFVDGSYDRLIEVFADNWVLKCYSSEEKLTPKDLGRLKNIMQKYESCEKCLKDIANPRSVLKLLKKNGCYDRLTIFTNKDGYLKEIWLNAWESNLVNKGIVLNKQGRVFG